MDSVKRHGYVLIGKDDMPIPVGRLGRFDLAMDASADLWVWCSKEELADLRREWFPLVRHGEPIHHTPEKAANYCNVVYPQGAFALYCYLQELKDGQS